MLNVRQQIAAGVAVVAVVAGVTIAATGSSSTHHPVSATAPAHVGRRAIAAVGGARDLAATVHYLGIPPTALQSELDRGHTLADIARATPGRSVDGLIAALSASRRARLAAALAAGRLTSTNERQISSHVRERVAAVVNSVPRAGGGRDIAVAASYLGLSLGELQSQRRSGKTLSQIAAASGRSRSGLIAALVAARKARLDAAVSAGKLTRGVADRTSARLTRRVTAEIDRVPPKPESG